MTLGILVAIAMGVGVFKCSYDKGIENKIIAKQEKIEVQKQAKRDAGAAKILKKDKARIEKAGDPCREGRLRECMETLKNVGTK